jgi:hypothetical protein
MLRYMQVEYTSPIRTCKGDGQEDGPHEEEEQKLSALRSASHGVD